MNTLVKERAFLNNWTFNILFLLIFYAPALIFKLDKDIANTSLKEKKI